MDEGKENLSKYDDNMSEFVEYKENTYLITYRYNKTYARTKGKDASVTYTKQIYGRSKREAELKARMLLPTKYAIVSVKINSRRVYSKSQETK